jgi:hypothetical protein
VSHIRIFPHSKEEFASLDLLTTWLLTALKARGGRYQLRSATAVAELPTGSIVLFRYGHVIVGEAVVLRHVRNSTKDRTLLGQETQYEAHVEFSPSSIRLFAPPFPVAELQAIVGDNPNITTSAMPYYRLDDWGVYPRLLAAHVGQQGAFL